MPAATTMTAGARTDTCPTRRLIFPIYGAPPRRKRKVPSTNGRRFCCSGFDKLRTERLRNIATLPPTPNFSQPILSF